MKPRYTRILKKLLITWLSFIAFLVASGTFMNALRTYVETLEYISPWRQMPLDITLITWAVVLLYFTILIFLAGFLISVWKNNFLVD